MVSILKKLIKYEQKRFKLLKTGAGYVKYGFPQASMTTILSWGLIRYRRTYETIGQLDYALDCIKWATDYFIKCHTDKFEFWAQVSFFNVFILSIVEKSQCDKMFL